MLDIEPIGIVRTPFEDPDDAPRQGMHGTARGTIHVEDAFVPGLDGIQPGDELIVIWYADEADRSLLTMDRPGNPGVFTSRSQSRPNPICLTTCVVESVEDGSVTVTGVDMMDGSPVLDLKPPIT